MDEIMEHLKSMQGYVGVNPNIPNEWKENAQKLCWEYNCDYGFNIHTHGLTVINYNCVILDTSPVNLGAGVFLAPGVCLACAGHALDPEQRAQGVGTSKPITLEDGVWIGANAVVCGGVTIGQDSVIGAGSVVTRDIPAGVVAAGVPCRVIRPITEADRIDPAQMAF